MYKRQGPDTDVPAGDIGVGGREVGYLFGQYKRLKNEYTGVLTGKGIPFGGSLARTEATGYGLCYFAKEMLADAGKSFEGQRVVISGSGNVAIYANQKATQLGGKVIAMSDSNGYIVDENGIDYKVMKEIKEVKRARIKTYLDYVPTAKYVEGSQGIWTCLLYTSIFLTAKAAVKDRVLGLRLGADDYIVKPFAMDELLSLIHISRRGAGRGICADGAGPGPLRPHPPRLAHRPRPLSPPPGPHQPGY